MIPGVITIIGIVLLIIIVIFMINNYLVKLRESKSALKNRFLLLLCFVTLFSSVFLICDGFDLRSVLDTIKILGYESTELRQSKLHIQNSIFILAIIEVINGCLLFLLHSNIKKEIVAATKKNGRSLSEWNKVE